MPWPGFVTRFNSYWLPLISTLRLKTALPSRVAPGRFARPSIVAGVVRLSILGHLFSLLRVEGYDLDDQVQYCPIIMQVGP